MLKFDELVCCFNHDLAYFPLSCYLLMSFHSSSHFGDTDDFDPFGDNYDNDRTENHALENATKLNYHSYMDKWRKFDTDLFYQVFEINYSLLF